MNNTTLGAMMLLTSLSLPAAAAMLNEAENNGTSVNNTLASAQALSSEDFSPNVDPNIFGNLPTLTVQGYAGGGDVDFFSFQANPGEAYFDIDNSPFSFDAALSFFDSSGALIAYADDSDPADPNSADGRDPFLGSITLSEAGTYFLAVSDYFNLPNALFGATFVSDLVRPDGGFGGNQTVVAGADASFDQNNAQAGSAYSLNLNIRNPVPEPGTIAMMLLGLGGLMLKRRSRGANQPIEREVGGA